MVEPGLEHMADADYDLKTKKQKQGGESFRLKETEES